MGKVFVQDLAKLLTPNTEMRLYDHVYSDDPFIIASANAILNEWIFNGVLGMRVRKHYGAGWECVEVDVDRDTVKDMETIPLDDDFEQILISAERYALGRTTYIVPMTVDYIAPLLRRLSGATLCVLLADIHSARSLGMECDARAWHNLEKLILQEQEERDKDEHRRGIMV